MPAKRESRVEADICRYARSRGWLGFKFVSPGVRGVPDRLFIRSRGGRSQTIFIEVKALGEEPTPQQALRADQMRRHGAKVYWFDSLEAAMGVLR